MTWGRDTDSDDAAGQLRAFVDAGGTLVDTADVYADGERERLIGALLDDLVGRDEVREVVPAALDAGLGLLPWSPLGRGVLTGKYRDGTPADSRAASPHFERFVGRFLDERSAGIVEAVATRPTGSGSLRWRCRSPGCGTSRAWSRR